MRNRMKKVRFKKGSDANRAMVRKLLTNFLMHGKIDTTVMRAKTLKSVVDRLTYKAMQNTPADRNILLKHLADVQVITYMTDVVGPSFKKRTGGYVTLMKLGPRQGDDAEMARVQWVKQIPGMKE